MQPDIVVVGHFSVDSIILPSNPEPCTVLGGSVAYASLVARRLGSTVQVLSNVGRDFPKTYLKQLKQEDIDLSTVTREPGQTTRFQLTYSRDLLERTLKLKTKGTKISADDIPDSLQAKAVHVGPIDQEVPLSVIQELRRCCDLVSLDPQGMTRKFDSEGNVSCCEQVDRQILELVDFYKSSVEEILTLTGKSTVDSAIRTIHDFGPKIVIATKGGKGSVLSSDGLIQQIPAYPKTKLVDPTGAGDTFIGAFLAEYLRKSSAYWCACVGSAAASLVVEGVGFSSMGEKAEIYHRANSICKNNPKT